MGAQPVGPAATIENVRYNLTNLATVLLNYRLGDVARFVSGACACRGRRDSKAAQATSSGGAPSRASDELRARMEEIFGAGIRISIESADASETESSGKVKTVISRMGGS